MGLVSGNVSQTSLLHVCAFKSEVLKLALTRDHAESQDYESSWTLGSPNISKDDPPAMSLERPP